MPSSGDGLHLAQVGPRFACFESRSEREEKKQTRNGHKKKHPRKRSRKLETNYQHFAGNSSKTDSPQCHHLQTPASWASRSRFAYLESPPPYPSLQKLPSATKSVAKALQSERRLRSLDANVGLLASEWCLHGWEVRDLQPRTSDYKAQDRAFMDEKSVLALSGWRSPFLLLQPWGFFIHEGSVILAKRGDRPSLLNP